MTAFSRTIGVFPIASMIDGTAPGMSFGMDKAIERARDKAYGRVAEIDWHNRYFRTDIGYRAIGRERARPA